MQSKNLYFIAINKAEQNMVSNLGTRFYRFCRIGLWTLLTEQNITLLSRNFHFKAYLIGLYNSQNTDSLMVDRKNCYMVYS